MFRRLFQQLFGGAFNKIQAAQKRKLFLEQFEDRRVMATAVNDVYYIRPNTVLTVEGLGL